MKLTSTQIGALAENLVANELMIESKGRLSPFQPIADDDGVDILIYDKRTGKAIPLQIKARTNTINKRGKQERSNTAYFTIRKASCKKPRQTMLLCVLLAQDLRSTERAWLLPLSKVSKIGNVKKSTYALTPNKSLSSSDKYKLFQCEDIEEVVRRLIKQFKELE